MSDTISKRNPPPRNPLEPPPSKRPCPLVQDDVDQVTHQWLQDRPFAPLSAPCLPDDMWRQVFHYLDVGHICTRMAILNRNWSRSCWRFTSAYVPGPQFKYRRTGYLNRLSLLPNPKYLHTLTLDNIKLTEAEIEPIYRFNGLVSLQLVVVRGRTFQNLSRLTSLRSLTTWNCEWVNTEVLKQIGRLVYLEHLTLNCCDQITDEGLEHLAALTNLLSLGLTDLTCISEVGLRHLSTLTNLKTITLAFNPVTDEMVKEIAEHHRENLEVLDLDASSLGEGKITDAGLAILGKLTKLKRLKLGYHTFSPTGLTGLSGLTNLESLSLESVEGCVTGDSLRSLSKLVHLRKLKLDSCPTFDDDAVSALAHFTELEHLDIAKTMVRHGLRHLSSETHPKLTYLDLSYSDKLDDTGLLYITQLTNLTKLHIFRCPKGRLTARGTRAFVKLKKLDLLDCRDCPISKSVSRILRSRVKVFREDLVLSGLSMANSIESEELPDSDDDTDSTPQSLMSSAPMPHLNTLPIHVNSMGAMDNMSGMNGSQMQKTEYGTTEIALRDDLRNFAIDDEHMAEMQSELDMEHHDLHPHQADAQAHQFDDTEFEEHSSTSMDVDEMGPREEVSDVQLLASMHYMRSQSLANNPSNLPHIESSGVPHFMGTSAMYNSEHDFGFDKEDLD